MPLVLVSDTSILIDLHRGDLIEVVLRLSYEFAVLISPGSSCHPTRPRRRFGALRLGVGYGIMPHPTFSIPHLFRIPHSASRTIPHSASAHSALPRFWTNCHPNRPFMHRCPRVMS